jgi:indole-3-glycerol phosphate synthase
MLNYEKEEELTIPEGINEKKSRMGEYGISILTKRTMFLGSFQKIGTLWNT